MVKVKRQKAPNPPPTRLSRFPDSEIILDKPPISNSNQGVIPSTKNNPNPGYVSPDNKVDRDEITFFDSLRNSLRIDIDRFDDQCNTGFQVGVKILFWRPPSFDFVGRNPECRLKQPINESYEIDCKPSAECVGSERALYIWHRANRYIYRDTVVINGSAALLWETYSNESVIESVEFPENEFGTDRFGNQVQVYARVTVTFYYFYRGNYALNGRDLANETRTERDEHKQVFTYYNIPSDNESMGGFDVPFNAFAGTAHVHYSDFETEQRKTYEQVDYRSEIVDGQTFEDQVVPPDSPTSAFTSTPFNEVFVTPGSFYFNAVGFKTYKFSTNASHIRQDREGETWQAISFCSNGEIKYQSCSLFPPLPPPPPEIMRCCSDNANLLKQILKIVKQNNQSIGHSDYPVTLPSSLVNRNGKEPGTEKVNSITQFIAWYVQRFDELLGQFEIPIEIEDTDLTKEGNQSLTVKLPNVAESIAEMFMMLMNLNITNEVQMNMMTRVLAETGADKQQNFKSYMALEAIVEFLGFSYDDGTTKLPLTFSPGEEELQNILKETEVDVSYIDYNDDINLPKQMHELLNAAAIIRAKHWYKLDTKGDIKKQILSQIFQSKDLIAKLLKEVDLEELEEEINKIKAQQNL